MAGTVISNQSIQLAEQTPGAGTAADAGNVRIDGTSTPGFRITTDTGVSFEINQATATNAANAAVADDVMPNWKEKDWFGARAGGATVHGIGMAPTIVGTPSNLQPSPTVALKRPMVNIAHAAATAGLAASVATPTYNYTDPYYKPDLTMTIEARAAADLLNARGFWGLYSAIPTNVAITAPATRNFGFGYDSAISNQLLITYNEIGSGATSTIVPNSGALVFAANLALRLRIKLTETDCRWYIDDVEEYHLVFGASLTAPVPLGVAASYITTNAAIKNIGFGDFMCIHHLAA